MSHPHHPIGPVAVHRFPLLATIPNGCHRWVGLALALEDLPAYVYADGTDLVIRAEYDAQGDALATLRAQVAWRLGAPAS